MSVSTLSANVADARFTLVDIFEEPSYRRLWVSGLCVSLARWMDLVTLGWLSFNLTGSPSMVGLAAFARSAPMMVIGPFAGIVADRFSRGRVLLVSQMTGLLTALALAALFATGRGGYWSLFALELAFGVAWALDFPARRTALYALLGAPRVAQAVSLETASMQIAMILGPLAAGIGLARFGPPASYSVMALVSMVGLLASGPLIGRLGKPSGAAMASLARTMRAGLKAAWTNPTVRVVLLITVAMNTLFFPYQQMLPVFARDVLSVGPVGLGTLVAADGCGALLGALVIAARRGGLGHRTIFGASVLAVPVLLLAFSGSRQLVLCFGLLLLMGVAESAYAAMQTTLVLLSAPERLRGGVMGILSACIGTYPLGTLAIGLLAGVTGVPVAFTINALVALIVIAPLAVPLLRGRPD